MITNANQRAMRELIHRHKQGLESMIHMVTKLYDIRVVFEGTRAYTKRKTIVLPNVDVFALHPEVTNEAIEEASAYFLALKGYAWREVGLIVESDASIAEEFARKHGSFANAIRVVLDEIRVEHRFGKRGVGISEAIEYTREQWVWPRFGRRKLASNEINLQLEVIYGLQLAMKHELFHDHQLWTALSPEAQSFVERSVDDLEAAHDTLKMDAKESGSRLNEIVVHMLERWHAEWTAVAPLAPRSIVVPVTDESAPKDAQAGLDVPKAEDILRAENGVSPFLLVTYGDRVSTLQSVSFAGGYARRVENMPSTVEEWERLQPLADGEARTLVVLPPDPEIERQLDREMAKIITSLQTLGDAIAEKAEEELAEATHELEKLPSDQQPYLVYTTANDRFSTLQKLPRSALADLSGQVTRHVGVVKRRLQVLLQSRTKSRFRGNQEEGDLIDPDAISRIVMSKHIPQSPVRPYMIELERDALVDTVCGILIDVSGSMLRNNKLELAAQAGFCFGDALYHARIKKFAMWAFTTNEDKWRGEYLKYKAQCEEEGLSDDETVRRLNMYGRYGALVIETVKTYEDSWQSVNTRLPAMGRVNHANYDADSLQWAVHQMLAQKAKRRVLFVLSDGLPDTSEPLIQVARQRRHLGDVVRSAIAQGVEIAGIGICDRSVELYYPHAVVIQSANDLPRIVMSEMEFLLLKNRRI